jgi:hypothetical protein
MANPNKGAHTQFKEQLKVDLNSRVGQTIKVRAGPSWDERMDKAVKGFQAKSKASEAEMKKNLVEAIEKGRSRKTSAPFRSASETPDQAAMLQARKKQMKETEMQYREQLDALRDKMEKREPLFRLSDVSAAFQMQRERAAERKREMRQDEHERWEHLKEVERGAAGRPLLIEDAHYRPPRKSPNKSASAPALEGGGAAATNDPGSPKGGVFFGREEYEKDIKIRNAINSAGFTKTEWAKQVADIKYRADNRVPLHEIKYPNKGDGHALTRNRLMHTSPSVVKAVY